MKVVIAGGGAEAEYIVSMFKDRQNQLVIINPSAQVAKVIAKRYSTKAYVGDPWRRSALDEANAYDADVFIALCEKDTDNFASCVLAKQVFGAKKVLCVVNNPKSVDLYKKLGIDSVISSSYLIGQTLRSESSVENLMKTLSLENDKITMIEAIVLSKYEIANKMLKDARFPKFVSVACIYRTPDVIIPKGDTMILPSDTLLLVCAPEDQKKVMSFIKTEKEKPAKPKKEKAAK